MHATFVAFYIGKKNYFYIPLKGIIDFPNKKCFISLTK